MNTIDDKAKELVEKFEKTIDPNFGILKKRDVVTKAKQCAIICADEMLNSVSLNEYEGLPENQWHYYKKFWQKVKEKIQSL